MNKQEKVKNIIAFLLIIFHENSYALVAIYNLSPDYLIEKYERYIECDRPESKWGMHPNIKTEIFDEYCAKWHLI